MILLARLCARRSARQRGGWAGRGASMRRSALRADSPAVLGLVAPSRNSLRSLRSLRSNRRDESDLDARCARGHKPCAPRRLIGAPRPAHPPLCRHSGGAPRPNASVVIERQAVPGAGAVCGAEQRSFEGGARSALRHHFCRILFERSERSERSELCGTPSRRAAQGSRRNAPTATACACAGHRLPRRAQAAIAKPRP